MVLEKGEYEIQKDNIIIPKKTLENLKQHFHNMEKKYEAEYKRDLDVFHCPYYIGKKDVFIDLLKLFEPLEA